MGIQFKQKCMRCRKNYVIMGRGQKFAVCYDCQKGEMKGKISDPKMKKMFDIPEDYYRQNAFLRDIKVNYFRFDRLTDKQIEAFKKTVQEIKEKAKKDKSS